MRITKKTAATGAMLVALATGAAVPVAFAQDATEESQTQQSETTREDYHAARQAEFAQALADELVSTSTGSRRRWRRCRPSSCQNARPSAARSCRSVWMPPSRTVR